MKIINRENLENSHLLIHLDLRRLEQKNLQLLKLEDCKHVNRLIENDKILNKIINRKPGDEDEIFNVLIGKGIFLYEQMIQKN